LRHWSIRSYPVVLVLSILVVFLGQVPANGTEVVWVYPAPRSLIAESPTPILGYLTGAPVEALEAEIRSPEVGTSRNESLYVFKGRLFSGSVELSPGRNTVVVNGAELSLFLQHATVAGDEAKDGFNPLYSHDTVSESCNPCHGFRDGSLILKKSIPGTCLPCHERQAHLPEGKEAAGSQHATTVAPDCMRCHEPHVSSIAGLLKDEPLALCVSCHEDQGKGVDHHPAIEEIGCQGCHDPHLAPGRPSTRVAVKSLCQECHDQGGASDSAEPHPPMESEKACATCHDPHGEDPALLIHPYAEVCATCHSSVLEQGHGSELEDCSSCHDPHGTLGGGMVVRSLSDACTECHDGIAAGATVHAALDDGCNVCHAPHRDDNLDSATASCGRCHDFTKDRELSNLHGELEMGPTACIGCHPPHASQQEKLVRGALHYPLTQGKCSSCHGKRERKSLKVDKLAARCNKCHLTNRKLRAMGGTPHAPVADGDCDACHDPHMSTEQALLLGPQIEICLECHDVWDERDGSMRHSAAEVCTDCHGGHGGKGEHFLTTQPPALCLDCHDDPAETYDNVHPALDDGCLVCHDPHGGERPAVLTSKEPDLCFGCHDEAAHEHPLRADMETEKEGGRDGFPASGNHLLCRGCHDPHGAGAPFLFAASRDNLCLKCHEEIP
jgi:predicted CXXCH cytochrome family protein